MDTFWELIVRTKLVAFQAQIQGMISENTLRERKDESPAYGDDAFAVIVQECANLEEQIRIRG